MRLDERVEAVLAQPAVAGLALFAAAAWLLWPVPLGHAPLSQDHTVHLFRAWHFFTKVLSTGRLTAWSDYWFAGWPAGQDYPPGADWWMAATRLLTFPCSWETTYAAGFFAMYVASALAIWRAGRSLGPVAALLGALFFVFDRGEYREGGFAYSVHWGVWPQQLSTAALLVGLCWLDEAIAVGRPRDYAKSAAALGWALLCHPLALVSLGVALPVWVVVHRVCAKAPLIRALGRCVGVAALAWAIAALFTMPFAARSGWMAAYGDLYRSLPSIALGLSRGNLFHDVPAPLVWLGLLGLGIGIWRRERAAILLGLFALATLVFASSTTIEALEHLSPSLGRIQYQRLVAPAKACLFLLAGWSLAPSWGRPWLRRIGWASLVAAPLWVAMSAPYPRVVTRDSFREWPKYEEFLAWSRAERARDSAFYRIAYVGPYNDHFFAAAPIWNDTPAYKVGFTPASNFLHKPDRGGADLYRVLGVKWVVTRGILHDPGLALDRRFGPISVYRFAGYTPERFALLGPGRARAERFEAEHVRLALEGTDATSRVVLHVASYSSWHARLDGRDVPIRTMALADEPIFMEVAAGGHALQVDFASEPVDLRARAVSAAALLVVALLVLAPARMRRLAALFPPEPALVGASALVLAWGLAWKVVARPAPPAWRARDQAFAARASLGDTACERAGGRLRCSEKSWNYVGPVEARIGGVRHGCIWAHPRAEAPLRITFPDVPAGRDLIVHHGLLDTAVDAARDGAPVKVDVSIDGRPVASGTQPNRKGWFSFRAQAPRVPSDVTFTVSAARDGARHFCFDAEVR
jgi:hypothetical protein